MSVPYNRNYDPADMDRESSYIKELFAQYDIARETCIPAVVIDYDSATNTVDVQPIPKRSANTDDGEVNIDRPVIKGVPVYQLCGRGCFVKVELSTGASGWLLAGDRNIASTIKKATGVISESAECDDYGRNMFQYGFFLPCSFGSSEEMTEWTFTEKDILRDGIPYGGSNHFVSGEDSNVVFTDLDDGTTAVDVYYV